RRLFAEKSLVVQRDEPRQLLEVSADQGGETQELAVVLAVRALVEKLGQELPRGEGGQPLFEGVDLGGGGVPLAKCFSEAALEDANLGLKRSDLLRLLRRFLVDPLADASLGSLDLRQCSSGPLRTSVRGKGRGAENRRDRREDLG